jgi:hypothetical protein
MRSTIASTACLCCVLRHDSALWSAFPQKACLSEERSLGADLHQQCRQVSRAHAMTMQRTLLKERVFAFPAALDVGTKPVLQNRLTSQSPFTSCCRTPTGRSQASILPLKNNARTAFTFHCWQTLDITAAVAAAWSERV